MDTANAQNQLSAALKEPLLALGFDESMLLAYERSCGDGYDTLAFGGAVNNGAFAFSFSVGRRFPELEKLLRPERCSESLATVGKPIHLLRPDTSYSQWSFSDGCELDHVVSEVLADIEVFAQPYWTTMRSVEDLQKLLTTDSSKSVHVLTAEQEIELTASVNWLLGDRVDAIETLDRALEARKTALPKKRRNLERLRKRLVAVGESG